MAETISTIGGAIDTRSKEIQSKIDGFANDLFAETSVARGSVIGAQSNLLETPTHINTVSAINIEPISTEFNALFNDIEAGVLESRNLIKAAVVPDAAVDLGDPLDGWAGQLPFTAETDTRNLLILKYHDPLFDSAIALIDRLRYSTGAKDIQDYLISATDYSGSVVSGVSAARSYSGKRCFTVPGYLDSSTSNSIANQISFEANNDVKFMQFVIEFTHKDFMHKANKLGVDLDKLRQKAVSIYGEAYIVIADYIDSKARKEADWFMRDYEARMKAQASNVAMNTDHYEKYIENLMVKAQTESDANIKSALSNFSNQLKKIASSVDLSNAEADWRKVLNSAAHSLYGVGLSDIAGAQSAQITTYLADKTAAVSSYQSLLSGYRGLLATSGQNSSGIVITKEK